MQALRAGGRQEMFIARTNQYDAKLFNFVKEEGKRSGCYHLTLNVWHLSTGALKFYEKLGMSPLKTTIEVVL